MLALGKRPMQDTGRSDQRRLWDYVAAWLVGDRIRDLFVQHAETVDAAALAALQARLGRLDGLVVWIMSERRDARLPIGNACRISPEAFLSTWVESSLSNHRFRASEIAAWPSGTHSTRSPALFDLSTTSGDHRTPKVLASGVSRLVASLARETDTDAEYEAALRGVGGTLSLFGVRFDHRHVRAFPRAAARTLAHLIGRDSLARFSDPAGPAALALAILTSVDARRLRALDASDIAPHGEVLDFDGIQMRVPATMGPSIRALIALRDTAGPDTHPALFWSMRQRRARITSDELHELVVTTAESLSLPLPSFHPWIAT